MSDQKPVQPETKAEEKKPQSTNKFGLRFTLIIAALLLLIIGWSTARAVQQQYQSGLDTAYESLANSLYAVRNLINFEENLQSSYESFDLKEAKIYTDVAKVYFGFNGVNEQTLNEYADRMGDCAIFYFPKEGKSVTSDSAEQFPLDETQLQTLKKEGTLETEDHDYSAVRLKDGWLCFEWVDAQKLYSVDFERILETTPSKLCVIEESTGKVLASSDLDAYDFLDESNIVYDTQRRAHEGDGIQAGTLSGSSLGSGVYFEKLRLSDRYLAVAYVNRSDILNKSLREIAPEFAIMALCFVFIWFCAMHLRKQGAGILDQNQCIQFTKNYYINLPVARHVSTLLLIGILFTGCISAFLPLLNSYTDHNDRMESNLNAFVNEMQLSNEEWNKMDGIFKELVTDRTQMIADMIDMMGDKFDNETLMNLSRAMGFVKVVLYDEKGAATMSTDGYTGYSLSQNSEDDEYAMWDVLRSADVSLMKETAEAGGYIVGVRRTDAPGLVCATLTDKALRSMREQTDVNTALLRVNTDTYGKILIRASQPETMLWATATGDKVRTIPNKLPENAQLASYFGTQSIGGYHYYLNTMSDDEYIIISAEHSKELNKPAVRILMQIMPGVLLLSVLILFASCVYREIDDWLRDDRDQFLQRVFATELGEVKEQDQELDESLKKMSVSLIWLVFTVLVALYVFDFFFSANPISQYLFSQLRERTFGVFSLTTILLIVAFAIIGVAVLKKLLHVLSGRLDSRAETVSNLVMSVIQFAVAVVLIIYSLYQLGVDTTVILTSAGVISLIIGYGSQSIVSDLVSGVFLIMEDQLRIGDTLIIDGFRGEVEHIGLRTTTLKHYASVKVINNSKMVDFFNYSRDTNASRWTMSFPVEQDIDQVKSLIMDNKDRFQKACKGNIIAGPIWTGITEGYTDYTGHSHYTIQIMFVTTIEEWNSVRKRSFETAYRIMLENGIKPSGGERKSI